MGPATRAVREWRVNAPTRSLGGLAISALLGTSLGGRRSEMMRHSHNAPGLVAQEAFFSDSRHAAHAVGLHYSSDTEPGILRTGRPRHWRYQYSDGRPLRDASVLKRIRGLVIPPAWTQV